MADKKGQIWLTYLVADESASMKKVVPQMNAGLESLIDAMASEGLARTMVRFSVVGFSDNVMEHLRAADFGEVENAPKLSSYRGTSYSAAFRDLYSRILLDVKSLQSRQYDVLRPAVFFITDGQPDKSEAQIWRSDLQQLKSETFAYRPNIVAFGFGEVVPEVILEVATKSSYAFVAPGEDIGRAVVAIFTELTRSIVQSGRGLTTGKAELVVRKPDQFVLALDVLPPA